jgi:hypothetical protein
MTSERRLVPYAIVISCAAVVLLAVLAPVAGASRPIPHPRGASDVVLRIHHDRNGWGAEYPDGVDVTVYGNGTVVIRRPGASDDAPPEPERVHVDEAGLQRLLREARKAGLLRDTDYGEAMVTDQGTSTITIDAGGDRRTVRVYALLLPDGDRGLTRDQREARGALRRFVHFAAQPGDEY